MGTEAAASAVSLLRSQIPFQTDGELVLPPRGVGLVLVDLCNGFCTVGAGNLVSSSLLFSFPLPSLGSRVLALFFLPFLFFFSLPLFIG
jgi:hypothetical protein